MITLKIAAQQPYYLPNFNYFHKIYCSDIFFIADFLRFRKQSPIVRADFNDFYLTIPVRHYGTNPHPPLGKVQLLDKKLWKQKHLGTLKAKYSSFPFFEYYYPDLLRIYQQDSDSLNEFLLEIIFWHVRMLFPNKRVCLCSQEGIFNLKDFKTRLQKFTNYLWLIHPIEYAYYKKHFSESKLKIFPSKTVVLLPDLYQPIMPLLVLLFLKGPETVTYFQ